MFGNVTCGILSSLLNKFTFFFSLYYPKFIGGKSKSPLIVLNLIKSFSITLDTSISFYDLF